MKVRKATREDLDWIYSELKIFSQFFGTKKSLFKDSEETKTKLENIIADHVCFVSENETDKTGFIIGIVTPHLMNSDIKMLAELFWWVPEVYRGSRAGYLLLKEFLAWGDKNADWISLAIEKNSPLNEQVLFKRGFMLQEKSYLKEVG